MDSPNFHTRQILNHPVEACHFPYSLKKSTNSLKIIQLKRKIILKKPSKFLGCMSIIQGVMCRCFPTKKKQEVCAILSQELLDSAFGGDSPGPVRFGGQKLGSGTRGELFQSLNLIKVKPWKPISIYWVHTVYIYIYIMYIYMQIHNMVHL